MSPFDAAQYWESRLASDYTLQGVGYSSLGRSYNSWMYRVRRHVFGRVITSLDLDFPNVSVLDVGSGTGFYVDLWKRMGVKSLTGVDITQTAVDRLSERFPDYKFCQADIGVGLPWVQTFDAITAFDVLFHIVSDDRFVAAIENCYQVLQAGGWFIFSDNFLHRQQVQLEHQVSRSLEDIERAVLDSDNGYRRLFWKALNRAVSSSEAAGYAVGAALFPFELALTRKGESASTEIMLCRKPRG